MFYHTQGCFKQITVSYKFIVYWFMDNVLLSNLKIHILGQKHFNLRSHLIFLEHSCFSKIYEDFWTAGPHILTI